MYAAVHLVDVCRTRRLHYAQCAVDEAAKRV